MSELLKEIAEAAPITAEQIDENLNLLRKVRDEFETLTMVDSALFFTDKLTTTTHHSSNCSPSEEVEQHVTFRREAYRMAKLLHEKEEYHRAAHYLTYRDLHKVDLSCRYLAAKCHVSGFLFVCWYLRRLTN